MGSPEQPHLPGTGDEPVEAPTVSQDDAAAVAAEDDAEQPNADEVVVGTDDDADDADETDAEAAEAVGDVGAGEGPEPEVVDTVGDEPAADDAGPVADDGQPQDAGEPSLEDPAAEEPAPAEAEVPGDVDDGPAEEGPGGASAGVETAAVESAAVESAAVEDPAVDDPLPPADEEPAEEPAHEAVDEAVPAAVPDPDTDEIPLSVARTATAEEPAGEPAPEVVAAPAAVRPAPAPLHRPRERARTRLLEAMRPKLNRGQLLAALLCAGLGFGLVTQIQSTQSEQLDALTQADLVRLLQEVNTEADRLAEQEASARDERERLAASETGDLEAEALTSKRLQALGVLAGTLPATGPGIRLTVTDPQGEVDAATLLDTLQELRDAGAEAVQINDVRVVASTSFQDLEGAVKVGDTPVRPPYTYLVIGDAETLDAAMRIPGGVLDVVEQKGGTGDVDRLDRVEVTALHRVLDPQYARPAPEASP